jgi:ABC-2 type transport system ATP-binding protein
MLSVSGLSKRFGSVTALQDVQLSVARGDIVGFLGPNGAGKTTTLRAIMRLITVDSGHITWDGTPVDDDVRRRFGYLPAERGMYPRMRVREHLVYYARLSGLRPAEAAEAADRWLERLGLSERADSDVQDLSSGNQQRVQLALALLTEPELLVLDEPFSGLDPLAVETLSEVLQERVAAAAALLLSSHQLDLVAELCTAVVIVDGGRVVLRGPVDELRAASDDRRAHIAFATDTAFEPPFDEVTVVARTRREVTLRTPRTLDPATLLAAATAAGSVQSFTFTPPDLSEVFRTAVGRPGALPLDTSVAGVPHEASAAPR